MERETKDVIRQGMPCARHPFFHTGFPPAPAPPGTPPPTHPRSRVRQAACGQPQTLPCARNPSETWPRGAMRPESARARARSARITDYTGGGERQEPPLYSCKRATQSLQRVRGACWVRPCSENVSDAAVRQQEHLVVLLQVEVLVEDSRAHLCHGAVSADGAHHLDDSRVESLLAPGPVDDDVGAAGTLCAVGA